MKLLVAVALATLGCGGDKKSDGSGAGDDKDARVASCNMPSVGTCREYRGANLAAGVDSLKQLCSPQISASAKFTETACPTDKVVATCQMREHKDFFYDGGMMPIASAEKDCARGDGKFTATK